MNAESYVNEIVKKVECKGKKKEEIRNQLLSDIAARREQGEALEEIMESMGPAGEIAEAFCQELPEEERRAYRNARRRKRAAVAVGGIFLVLFLAAVYFWWVLPKRADSKTSFSREEITEKTAEVVELLNADDFETLKELALEELHGALTRENIDKARAFISDDWGEMRSLGTVYAQEMEQKGKHFTVTQVDAVYEKVNVMYTITFDEEGRLTGVYMR